MAQQTFQVAAGGDDGFAESTFPASYPPAYLQHQMAQTTLDCSRAFSGGGYWANIPLLRFDTSTLPDNATITAATLQIQTTATPSNPDSRSLTASWNSWNGTSSDYSTTAQTDALAGLALSSIGAAGIKNIPLDNVTGVSKTGTTYLKLFISGGQPTGVNNLTIASFEHATAQEARLIVDYDLLFPEPPEFLTSAEHTDTTSHDIPVGSFTDINQNDIILVAMAFDGNPTLTLPSGYTSLLDQADGTAYKLAIFWRRAVGDEGNVTVQTNVAEKSALRMWRITGAHTTTAPAVASAIGASDTSPNPPNLDPANWATEATLWFAITAASSANTDYTGFPTNYTNTAEVLGGTDNTGAALASGSRQLEAASEDPLPFTTSANRQWIAATVAIRPGTGQLLAGTTRQVRYNISGRASKSGQIRYNVPGRASKSGQILYNQAAPNLQASKSAQILYNVIRHPEKSAEIRYNISALAGKTGEIGYAIGGPAIDPATVSTPYRLSESAAEVAMLRGQLGQIDYRYLLWRSNELGERLSEIRTVEEASFSLDNARDHTWELSLPMDVARDLDIWGDWVKLEVQMLASGYEITRAFGHYYFDERGGNDSPERRQWNLGGKSAEARLMGSTAELGYSIPAGTGILANVRQLLLDQGVPVSMIVFPPEEEDVAMGTTTHFDPFQSGTDTRWLRIANTILAAGGFLALFADNEGRMTTRKINPSNSIEPSHTYGTTMESDRMITSESINYVYDDENFANRVVVYSGDPSEAASFGVAENHDPNSRVSFERLGYWVQKNPIELPSLVSPSEAEEVARQALRVASGMNLRLNFETILDTRIRPRQAYGLEVFGDDGEPIWTGDVWPVMTVSATLDLSPMRHEVQVGVRL
jgi:hypothetical protein